MNGKIKLRIAETSQARLEFDFINEKLSDQSDLKSLEDERLVELAQCFVKIEQSATLQVIRHFQEIYDRELYLKYGYANFFLMATKYFGYCAGSAQLRINAMKLLNALPEIAAKIESQELTLTTLASVQAFFQAEAKSEKVYSTEQKLEVLSACAGKSTRDVQRELATRNPNFDEKESVRYVSKDRARLTMFMSEELLKDCEALKNEYSHVNPNMSFEELFTHLVAKAKKQPKQRKMKVDAAPATPTTLTDAAVTKSEAENADRKTQINDHEFFVASISLEKPVHAHEVKRSRYVPSVVRHQLRFTKNKGCSHVSQITGEICGSRHLLQMDHVHEFSRGGAHDIENMRWLCARHNRYAFRRNQLCR